MCKGPEGPASPRHQKVTSVAGALRAGIRVVGGGLETWPGAFQAASLGLHYKSTGKLEMRSEDGRRQRWM